MAGSEGSDTREEFKHDVAKDLAAASGLPAANFRIQDVSPGSIILDMQVMPDLLAPGAHLLAAKDLAQQAVDPSSTLRSGKITSHATEVQVRPSLPPSPISNCCIAEEAGCSKKTTRRWALWVYIGGAVLLFVIVLSLMAAAEAKAKAETAAKPGRVASSSLVQSLVVYCAFFSKANAETEGKAAASSNIFSISDPSFGLLQSLVVCCAFFVFSMCLPSAGFSLRRPRDTLDPQSVTPPPLHQARVSTANVVTTKEPKKVQRNLLLAFASATEDETAVKAKVAAERWRREDLRWMLLSLVLCIMALIAATQGGGGGAVQLSSLRDAILVKKATDLPKKKGLLTRMFGWKRK